MTDAQQIAAFVSNLAAMFPDATVGQIESVVALVAAYNGLKSSGLPTSKTAAIMRGLADKLEQGDGGGQ